MLLLALRIHISPDTKSTLDELGGYTLEERGEITMKVCYIIYYITYILIIKMCLMLYIIL